MGRANQNPKQRLPVAPQNGEFSPQKLFLKKFQFHQFWKQYQVSDLFLIVEQEDPTLWCKHGKWHCQAGVETGLVQVGFIGCIQVELSRLPITLSLVIIFCGARS